MNPTSEAVMGYIYIYNIYRFATRSISRWLDGTYEAWDKKSLGRETDGLVRIGDVDRRTSEQFAAQFNSTFQGSSAQCRAHAAELTSSSF